MPLHALEWPPHHEPLESAVLLIYADYLVSNTSKTSRDMNDRIRSIPGHNALVCGVGPRGILLITHKER